MRTEQDGASGGKEEAEAGQEPGKLWKPRDAGFKLPTDSRRGSKPCRIRNSKFRTYCHMKIRIRKASKSSPYKAVRGEHPTDKGREPERCAYKTGKRSRLRFLVEEQLTHSVVLVPGARRTDSLVLYVAPCSPVWPPPVPVPRHHGICGCSLCWACRLCDGRRDWRLVPCHPRPSGSRHFVSCV